jgi:hypothetical protein
MVPHPGGPGQPSRHRKNDEFAPSQGAGQWSVAVRDSIQLMSQLVKTGLSGCSHFESA